MYRSWAREIEFFIMAIKNSSLTKAKSAKEDEFYTQLSDIERELRHYRKHFKGKTVLCNCDDPFESDFFKYFVLNFNRLGLKQLIATCYSGSSIAGGQLSLFDISGNEEDEGKPYKAIVNKVYDTTGDGGITMLDIAELFKSGENELSELKGNGDFRSDECIELLKTCDIVVTNPPFSLFREFLSALLTHDKKFLIIGSQNAITYKEIFPLLKENKLWLGYKAGDMAFRVPSHYEPRETRYWQDESGQKWRSMGNVCWFTNLDHKKRHEETILYKQYNENEYPTYENFTAIEVSKVSEIPCDWSGVMGVPITFMYKYNPDQFEIVGHPQSNILPEGWEGVSQSFVDLYYEQGNKGAIREGWINPVYIDKEGKAVIPYQRILIKNKNPEPRG